MAYVPVGGSTTTPYAASASMVCVRVRACVAAISMTCGCMATQPRPNVGTTSIMLYSTTWCVWYACTGQREPSRRVRSECVGGRSPTAAHTTMPTVGRVVPPATGAPLAASWVKMKIPCDGTV